MMKTVIYDEEGKIIGELEAYFDEYKYANSFEVVELLRDGLKIREISKSGERCHPLAVLHTISSENCSFSGVCFKLIEYKSPLFHLQQQEHPHDTQLFGLHSTCLRENKTVVVPFGDEDIHFVAMRSRRMDKTACFWGFSLTRGLYEACLDMLNLRCLGIVFDLDETLIVANTLRSFEDRIEALQRKLIVEIDSQRIAGMTAEVKRYQEDKAILKQYAETDQVVDNGKVHKIQAEVVPALSDNHQTIVRPLIRLPDKNIVLTRINPQIRDTSVLVRLRPAWEELRSYLTARGRKRFEVYVCTMAERDYALEMWRLLDPDSNLISTTEVLDRIVCVKSGSKKSLFNVFHDGICHPKMGLVIDDRLKVWDEKDQPRVHVVPAFAPYYSPQAEANNAIPVLCVARNVACNVRGGFFKEFDDVLLPRINEVHFEDNPKDVPIPPDVKNYLVAEDDGSGSNGNKELGFDGMADAEVERRLKEAALVSTAFPSAPSPASVTLDPKLASSLPFTMAVPSMAIPQPTAQASLTPFLTNLFSQAGPLVRPLNSIGPPELGLHNSPAREEGEVPESELDPDTRRRLLILQHGHDFRETLPNEAQFPVRSPLQAPVAGHMPGPLPLAGPGPGPGPVPIQAPGPGSSPVSVPRVQSRGSWFPVEGHMSPGPMSRPGPKEYPIGPDSGYIEKQRPPPFQRRVDSSVRSNRPFPEKLRPAREAPQRDDRLRSSHSLPGHQSFKGDDISLSRSSSIKDSEVVPKRGSSFPETPSGALYDIAAKVGAKVEFKTGLVRSTELRFLMEAYFSGERVGEGTGVKRKEAQYRASEAALMNLADRYLTHIKSDSSTPQSDTSRGQSPNNIRNPSDSHSPGDRPVTKEETSPSVEPTKPDDSNVDDSKDSASSVSALKELCMKDGLSIDFRAPSPSSTSTNQGDQVHVEVTIDGKVLGQGTGLTWDEAKIQAAEKALASLKSMPSQLKRPGSPRSLQVTTNKRYKAEYPQVYQRMPSSRNPRNASPVL
ncbi:RNA polymerase II C-terminal domain phosphatase-like 1 [Silene latifolia]|uniref:RNA polymerase II C-terminal domain phosphatase-like 1 n=1 Tax=Silene latifolia TaxID=37657 RepID=UPI003D788521